MTKLRERRQRGSGQALVEFAIVLPVLVAIILGLLDLGRAIYTYNTLAQAARQASRTAIVNQVTANVQATAISAGATLGLNSANVDVCFKDSDTTQTDCSNTTDNCPQASREIGCLAIVRTHVSYAPMTPIVSILFSTINLASTSIEPIEYVCPEGAATTCT